MTAALFAILYFSAMVVVFIVNDKLVRDWDYTPGYVFYVVLAPATLPVTILLYLAYQCYTKLIKPRIIK